MMAEAKLCLERPKNVELREGTQNCWFDLLKFDSKAVQVSTVLYVLSILYNAVVYSLHVHIYILFVYLHSYRLIYLQFYIGSILEEIQSNKYGIVGGRAYVKMSSIENKQPVGLVERKD